jgi:hypothetical protein
MLQSVRRTFSSRGVGGDNNVQGIRPATYLLFIPSQCRYVIEDWLWLLGLSGVQLDCSLQVLRVFSLEPPRVGGPLDQWWCQSVGMLFQPTAVGDAVVLHSVFDGRDS